MKRVAQLRATRKILIIPLVGALVVAALFFGTQIGGSDDLLSQAVEGGELTLTSVNRNYESITQFTKNNETQARQLLEAARAALESAATKLNTAGRSTDLYVLRMRDNYARMAKASDTMAQGMDSLLFVSRNLTDAIFYYAQKDFEKASEQASYCIEVLAPLLSDYIASDEALSGIDRLYVAPARQDQLTLGVNQFKNDSKIYAQYILLLQSIMEGKASLQKNAELEEKMNQLQSAIANGDYQKAEELRQQISDILQSLGGQSYQDAANLAAQLDPNMLGGTSASLAQELRNRLRTREGLQSFENYLQSLEKYLEALSRLQQGDPTGAQQAITEGRGILQGQGNDEELQGLFTALRDAFNTLEMRIKGQPDQG